LGDVVGYAAVSGFKPSFKENGVQAVLEFPKYVTVAGKPELARDAKHEAELRNCAGVIDPASCEPRLPGAEGDQIPAPIEPPVSVFAASLEVEKQDTLDDRTLVRAGETTSNSTQLVRVSLERIGVPAIGTDAKPHVLIPFDLDEAVTVAQAARIAGRTIVTVRAWAANFDLGRPVGGRWMISRVALAMFLESDRLALAAYLSGDRESRLVVSYFARFGLDPKKIEKERIN
jgi:hypothetical protein